MQPWIDVECGEDVELGAPVARPGGTEFAEIEGRLPFVRRAALRAPCSRPEGPAAADERVNGRLIQWSSPRACPSGASYAGISRTLCASSAPSAAPVNVISVSRRFLRIVADSLPGEAGS